MPNMISPADYVISKFGGLRKTADALGLTASVVQGWKARGRVPEPRWDDVIAAAKKAGHKVIIDDFRRQHPDISAEAARKRREVMV